MIQNMEFTKGTVFCNCFYLIAKDLQEINDKCVILLGKLAEENSKITIDKKNPFGYKLIEKYDDIAELVIDYDFRSVKSLLEDLEQRKIDFSELSLENDEKIEEIEELKKGIDERIKELKKEIGVLDPQIAVKSELTIINNINENELLDLIGKITTNRILTKLDSLKEQDSKYETILCGIFYVSNSQYKYQGFIPLEKLQIEPVLEEKIGSFYIQDVDFEVKNSKIGLTDLSLGRIDESLRIKCKLKFETEKSKILKKTYKMMIEILKSQIEVI